MLARFGPNLLLHTRVKLYFMQACAIPSTLGLFHYLQADSNVQNFNLYWEEKTLVIYLCI